MLDHVRAGAVLYTKETPSRDALNLVAQELLERGWRVGGVVQEIHRHKDGYKTQVDIIDVSTGERIPINRPTREQIENNECSLNLSALTDATAVLRKAIADRVDLVVVEKFGEQEQQGGGLADEILHAMADGIPILVAVPAGVQERWQEFTGGCSDLLPCEVPALLNWCEALDRD
ncbi:DUF2478 domain-containing protein [Pseudomaricurvus alkylphenolicus]|uniref:DUF2478 domain-containing protein n=1 Tax=Pseudomaricurvus alkylphenolicus TaxID=1306991 RepID=UPI0014227C40|nr:DUF2478 domain-containing protein [Pseudomaricurvus alkylphenolicus]NIB40474.1 DUF2478 domain-containing protein [Pseudomaricurvus alkylphenolicus]